MTEGIRPPSSPNIPSPPVVRDYPQPSVEQKGHKPITTPVQAPKPIGNPSNQSK